MSKVQNFALTSLAGTLRAGLPVKYIVGVILSYIVNAALMAFLLYPTFLRIANGGHSIAVALVIAGAVVVQYFRYLIVFTDQLIPNGVQSSKSIVMFVAFGMFMFSCIEVYHACAGIDWLIGSQFWSLVLFGWGIVAGGYLLEISFVKKMNELTDIENNVAYVHDREVKQQIREQQKQSPTPKSDAVDALKYFTGWAGVTNRQWEILRNEIDRGATEQELKDLHTNMIFENSADGKYKPGGEMEDHPGRPFEMDFASKNGHGGH